MFVLFPALGAFLILTAVHDLFHTVFHPAATGGVSDWIAGRVWRAMRRMGPKRLSLAGPLAFVCTVGYWLVSLMVGFGLIYIPFLPQHFVFAQGLNPQNYHSLGAALVVSLCSLMTLSNGVYAKGLALQCLIGSEAVLGFALLTASISWMLSIYPVLEHRRSLAHAATLLHFWDDRYSGLDSINDSDLAQLLTALTSQMTTLRNELTQFPITYYFYENDQCSALPGILLYLAEISQQSASRRGAAGMGAVILGGAIDDYLRLLAASFLHCRFENREEVLRAFARDQFRKSVHAPSRQPKAA